MKSILGLLEGANILNIYSLSLQGLSYGPEVTQPDVSTYQNIGQDRNQRKPKIHHGHNPGFGFGKYKFFCELCKKAFSQKQHLLDHNRKHDGSKLQCSYCTKTFGTLRGLEFHTPTHTGVWPFFCSGCNSGFNLRAQLLKHQEKCVGKL